MEEKKVHAGKPSFASTSWRCGEIILLSLWLKLDWWFACKFIWLVWTEFPKEGGFLSRRTHKTIMWPFKKVQFGPTLARFFPDSVWDYKQEKQIKWKAAFPGSGPGGIIQITFFFLAPSFERPSFEFSSQNGLGMVISPSMGRGERKKKKEIYCIFSNTPAGSIRFSLELAIFPSFSPSPPFIFLLPSVWRRLSSIFLAKREWKKEGKLERKPHHSSDRRTEKNGNKQEHYKQTISWSGEEAAGRHTH